MLKHQITRVWEKWECSCGDQFVTKREADAHVEDRPIFTTWEQERAWQAGEC